MECNSATYSFIFNIKMKITNILCCHKAHNKRQETPKDAINDHAKRGEAITELKMEVQRQLQEAIKSSNLRN